MLTNVALDHTDVLGETREEIAAEKLAVVAPGAVVVLGEPEWEAAARALGAARVDVLSGSNLGLAVAAAEAFLGERVDPHAAEAVRVPGGSSAAREHPLEIWDGAHNIAGVGYLLGAAAARGATPSSRRSSPTRTSTAMLRALSPLGDTLVATRSANARALPAGELAALARRTSRPSRPSPTRAAALAACPRARGPDGASS